MHLAQCSVEFCLKYFQPFHATPRLIWLFTLFEDECQNIVKKYCDMLILHICVTTHCANAFLVRGIFFLVILEQEGYFASSVHIRVSRHGFCYTQSGRESRLFLNKSSDPFNHSSFLFIRFLASLFVCQFVRSFIHLFIYSVFCLPVCSCPASKLFMKFYYYVK